jgi:hypothetical protein
MKEAPGSSETSVLTRATRRNNPEDTILQVLCDSCARSLQPGEYNFIQIELFKFEVTQILLTRGNRRNKNGVSMVKKEVIGKVTGASLLVSATSEV